MRLNGMISPVPTALTAPPTSISQTVGGSSGLRLRKYDLISPRLSRGREPAHQAGTCPWRIVREDDCHAPGRIRTCDLALRRRALYPLSYGRGEGLVYPPWTSRLRSRPPRYGRPSSSHESRSIL